MNRLFFLLAIIILCREGFPQSFQCGTSTVTDIDGFVYHTVQMGERCWTKENMRTTRYANGNPVGIYMPSIFPKEIINTPGMLKIGFKLSKASNVSVDICSVNGVKLFGKEFHCREGNIDITLGLGPTGLYIVTVRADGVESSYKVVGCSGNVFSAEATELNTTVFGDQVTSLPNPRRYYDYNNDPANDEKFGKLYTATSALDADVYNNPSLLLNVLQGICPDGWHVSNDTDWMTLEHFKGMSTDDINLIFSSVRGSIGYTLLTSDTTYWEDACGTGKDEFDGRGGGNYQSNGQFKLLKKVAFWITYNPVYGPMLRYTGDCGSSIYRTTIQWQNIGDAYSVRCVKDY